MPTIKFANDGQYFNPRCTNELPAVQPGMPGNCGICVTPNTSPTFGCVCADNLRHLDLSDKMTFTFGSPINDTEFTSGSLTYFPVDPLPFGSTEKVDISWNEVDFSSIRSIDLFKNPASACGWIGGEVTYEETWNRVRLLEGSNPPVYEFDTGGGSRSPPAPFLETLGDVNRTLYRPEEWTPRPASLFDTWYAEDVSNDVDRWIVTREGNANHNYGWIATLNVFCSPTSVSVAALHILTSGRAEQVVTSTLLNGQQDRTIFGNGLTADPQNTSGFPGHPFGMGRYGHVLDPDSDGPFVSNLGPSGLVFGGGQSAIMPATGILNVQG